MEWGEADNPKKSMEIQAAHRPEMEEVGERKGLAGSSIPDASQPDRP